MKNNNYTLNDFIREYKGDYCQEYETYIGMEFMYKNTWYRMSREVGDNDRFYLIKVSLIDEKKPGYSENLKYEILAIYDTIYELLESRAIDNKLFQDILFDEETEILSQD